MFNAVLIYAKERSPLAFTAILSLLLFAAGLKNFDVHPALFLSGWLSMFIFLFMIRLSDDICDIPIDSITHPQRALCSGLSPLQTMNRFRLLAIALFLALQLGHPGALLFAGLTLLFFGVFFKLKPGLHPLVHTTLLNASLCIFPVYSGLLLYGEITQFHLLMGGFFWLGGLAHDYSHSLLDTRDSAPETLNPINRIDQGFLAKLSLLLFLVSGALGLLLAYSNGLPWGFLGGLVLMLVLMLRLEYKLIRHPSQETAKPFYIFGFLFFLVPVLGHLGDLAYGYPG